MTIRRRKTRKVSVGNVKIGADAPISIQSMTKTDTENISQTVRQIKGLEKSGCEIIRVAVKNLAAAKAIEKIKSKINIPLVADIHFNYQLAQVAIKSGADAIRLNPGNINKKNEVETIAKLAKKKGIPIRIGVNSGSLDINGNKNTKLSVSDLMVQSALNYIGILEDLDFPDIIVSLKASDIFTTIEAYKKMASEGDWPFHLGITAAGLPKTGIIKSAIGIGTLLTEGIGDTIRVSLTGNPTKEVEVAKEILQSLCLRKFGPQIVSCPTCGRCEINLIRIVKELENKMSRYLLLDTRYSNIKIAVMGCIVNGPGEAKDADIGIAGGRGVGVLFKRGRRIRNIKEKEMVDVLIDEIKQLRLDNLNY